MIGSRTRQSRRSSRFLAGLCAILALTLGAYAARQYVSEYLAASAIHLRSLSKAHRAVTIFEEDPSAQQALGMILLENGDKEEAVRALEHAAALREYDYKCWQLLGTAKQANSDLSGAEAAYRRAIELAPNYSQPNYSLGKLLLQTGRQQEGFKVLSKAAENSFSLFPQIVDLADDHYQNDAEAIEQAANPKTLAAKTYLARYLISRSLMAPNTRSFLLDRKTPSSTRSDFINLLIEKQNFPLAHEIWRSMFEPAGTDDEAIVFDGGFEHTSDSEIGAFGWHFDQELPGVFLTRTQQQPYSGAYAIHLKFSGMVPTGRTILSQLMLVQPDSEHVLRFYYRSPEILSASPPVIIVTDPAGGELGRSAILKGTENGWVEMSVNFRSDRIPAVIVALLRRPCEASPCPIFGELSLDDFSVTGPPSR